jgi:carbonic anhydrase/acetyltransferase-like protein (isoleucine patch superfamily)
MGNGNPNWAPPTPPVVDTKPIVPKIDIKVRDGDFYLLQAEDGDPNSDEVSLQIDGETQRFSKTKKLDDAGIEVHRLIYKQGHSRESDGSWAEKTVVQDDGDDTIPGSTGLPLPDGTGVGTGLPLPDGTGVGTGLELPRGSKCGGGFCIGGFLDSERNLDQNSGAWVDDEAIVYGNARVSGNARIKGEARVFGKSRVSGDSVVGGNALIKGNARIQDKVVIGGNAEIKGNAIIYENALIGGNVKISDNARIGGNAKLRGDVTISGNVKINGYAAIAGDTEIKDDVTIFGNMLIAVKDAPYEYHSGRLDEHGEEIIITPGPILIDSGCRIYGCGEIIGHGEITGDTIIRGIEILQGELPDTLLILVDVSMEGCNQTQCNGLIAAKYNGEPFPKLDVEEED